MSPVPWVQSELPPPEPAAPQPETLPLNIVYEDADLIVIGSHRKGVFATTFSGSVSSDVVRISRLKD